MERKTAHNVERAFRNQDYPTTHTHPPPGQGIVFLGLGWVPFFFFWVGHLKQRKGS